MRDQPVPSISMLQNSLSNHGTTLNKTSRMYGGHVMHGAQDSLNDEFETLTRMKNGITKAYKQGKYCDIMIKSKDGTEVQAHRLILATQSMYFMKKFDAQPDMKELEISDVNGDAIKVIIDFLYTQKIKSSVVNKDNAKDILKAGEIFNIEEIKEEAAIFMAKNLDEENIIDVMTNSVFAGAISNNAFTYAANNFQLLLEKDHLKKRLLNELNASKMCHLLSQKNLMLWDKNGIYLDALEREKQLFFFVMGFVAHDIENRLADLESILTCLKLPILIHANVLSVTVMAKGLKKKPEELAGMLSDILEPFDNLTGKENLAILFANDKKKKRSQSERRLLADTCKMRYATIPHSTSCSDMANASQPWSEKVLFCPGLNEPKAVFNKKQVIRSLTVFTSNTSLQEKQKPDDTNQFDRRVSGIKVKYDNGKEDSLGLTDHHSTKQETYDLEEGEFVTEVHTHHPAALIKKPGNSFLEEIHSLTTIHDISFGTNKDKQLGPMKESDLPLGVGLTLRVPSKIRHLEKNCPGKFCWLQGFGSEEIKIDGTEGKKTLYPIWGFKTHFKVYSVKNQELEFVAGIKKLYQFSIASITDNTQIDDLEDIYQIERSPVHEVVDLDDSDSNEEELEGAMQPGIHNNEDSIMVVDSESEEGSEDDESFDESGYLGHGILPMGQMGYGYPPMHYKLPDDGQGGENEPIEIESSSEGEEPNLADVEEAVANDKTSAEAEKGKNPKKLSNKEKNGDKNRDATKELTGDDQEQEEAVGKETGVDLEKEQTDSATKRSKRVSGKGGSPTKKVSEKGGSTSKRTSEKGGSTTESISDKEGSPKKRMSGKGESMIEKVAEKGASTTKKVSEKGGSTPRKGKESKSPTKTKTDEKDKDSTNDETLSDTSKKDKNKENNTENGDESPDKKNRRKKGDESESKGTTVETPEKKGRPKRGADEKAVEDTPGKKKKRGVK